MAASVVFFFFFVFFKNEMLFCSFLTKGLSLLCAAVQCVRYRVGRCILPNVGHMCPKRAVIMLFHHSRPVLHLSMRLCSPVLCYGNFNVGKSFRC